MLKFRSRFILPFLIVITLSGCGSVNYDDQADQQLTAITQETNQQFTTWISQTKSKSPVAYDSKFYDKVEADIKALEIRMEASQDAATQKLVPVFQSLVDQFENLRNFHISQKTFSDSQFLQAESDLINAQLASLITFELSLKPSTASGSPSAKTQSTATATTAQKVPAATATVKAAISP